MITCCTETWEIILYGQQWPAVVEESHLLLKEIGIGLNCKVTLITINAIAWAGPRLARRDAIKTLGFAAISAAAGPVATLLTKPGADPMQLVISYLTVLVIVFFPGLLLIYLTK